MVDAASTTADELVRLFRLVRHRMRQVPEAGLTSSQASVLLRLDREGPSSTTLLAEAEGMRSPSMTAILHGLERDGLVERRADPSDGRRQIVSLTAAGRSQAHRDREGRREWLADVLAGRMTADELARAAQMLAALRYALESDAGAEPPAEQPG